jgi:hypothetical protein
VAGTPAGPILSDFTCRKHRLLESTAHFGAQRTLHIGDTSLDECYARLLSGGPQFTLQKSLTG